MTRNVSSSFMSSTLKRRRITSNYLTSLRSVTCVEFGRNEYEIFSAGAVDSVVKCWDIRRINRIKKKEMSRPVYEISCSSQKGTRRGISSSKLLGAQHGTSRLLVNVSNDSVAVLDLGVYARNCQPKTNLRCVGHRTTSFYSKATFSTEGDFIAAASADGLVYVWDAHLRTLYDQTLNLSNSSDKSIRRLPCLALKGHENEVSGFAWNLQDLTQLVSCSDDGTVRCWQVDGERLERSKVTQFQVETSHENDSDNYNTTHWTNWNDFILQPDGYAYRIQCLSVPKLSSSVNHLADSSLRATHYETTSHLSSIHTLGELKEKQQSDRHFEHVVVE
ncbi:putative WD40/YVTN repeat-like-containing domain superfamily, WD40-repeat-containing [Plasmopara halstedii]